MRKSTSVLLMAVIYMAFFAGKMLNSSAPPAGYSGSLGDGNSCASCHGGGNATGKSVNISHNIPGTGYIPGTTYQITVTGNQVSGSTKYGFQASVERTSNNAKIGILSNQNSQTSINSTHWVNQNSTGTTGTATSKSWTFNWQAPAAGNGAVKIYAAVNFTDATGGTGGDIVLTQNVSVSENVAMPLHNVQFNYDIKSEGVVLTWDMGNSTYDELELYKFSSAANKWKKVTQFKYNESVSYLDKGLLSQDNYYRFVINENGQHSNSEIYMVHSSFNQSLVYNPSTQKVHVAEALQGSYYVLMNTSGTVFREGIADSEISLDGLSSGLYILQSSILRIKIFL
jgi:hypothetical protein